MTVLTSSNSAETMVSGHIRYSLSGSGVLLMVVALVWVTRRHTGMGGTYLPTDDICLNNVNSKQTHSPILIVVSAL